jgi:hypothetical protein
MPDDPLPVTFPTFGDWMASKLGFQLPVIHLPQTAKNLDKAIGRIIWATGADIASRIERSTSRRAPILDSTEPKGGNLGAGRHPHLYFRGLLRLRSRCGPSDCSTAKSGFVARLLPVRLPAQTARQLPDQSTILRVEPSSTGNPAPSGHTVKNSAPRFSVPKRSGSKRRDEDTSFAR